ncbi:hypothetical protein DFH08DRAFT_1039274 [Mycena albidolilacea]|uniref:Uncharacterized protein n=1 Tax=Mycena albidolilacea TaxID=1033008 RepID=A0AAD7EZL6_9AGAR|nr:hypothetical protein DFH08DRAFT_1039274 [Mycena albidolilacea]
MAASVPGPAGSTPHARVLRGHVTSESAAVESPTSPRFCSARCARACALPRPHACAAVRTRLAPPTRRSRRQGRAGLDVPPSLSRPLSPVYPTRARLGGHVTSEEAPRWDRAGQLPPLCSPPVSSSGLWARPGTRAPRHGPRTLVLRSSPSCFRHCRPHTRAFSARHLRKRRGGIAQLSSCARGRALAYDYARTRMEAPSSLSERCLRPHTVADALSSPPRLGCARRRLVRVQPQLRPAGLVQGSSTVCSSRPRRRLLALCLCGRCAARSRAELDPPFGHCARVCESSIWPLRVRPLPHPPRKIWARSTHLDQPSCFVPSRWIQEPRHFPEAGNQKGNIQENESTCALVAAQSCRAFQTRTLAIRLRGRGVRPASSSGNWIAGLGEARVEGLVLNGGLQTQRPRNASLRRRARGQPTLPVCARRGLAHDIDSLRPRRLRAASARTELAHLRARPPRLLGGQHMALVRWRWRLAGRRFQRAHCSRAVTSSLRGEASHTHGSALHSPCVDDPSTLRDGVS